MLVLVGSINPVKLNVVEEVFQGYFPHAVIRGIGVESNVPPQPMDDEIVEGATNRAQNLRHIDKVDNLGAEFFVGVEGGIVKQHGRWFDYGCVVVIRKDGREGLGKSAHFQIPDMVIEQILQGDELGVVMDRIQNAQNTKQKQGAIGYFSKGKMDRKELYSHSVICALLPFLNEEMYFT